MRREFRKTNTELYQRFRTLSAWFASAVLCIAGLVLVGWAFGLTLLTSLSSQFASMKVTTATGLACLAGSILLLLHGKSRSSHPAVSKRNKISSMALAMFAGLLGAGTLVGYTFGWEEDFAHPGWMAQSTAICFVLMGMALLFSTRHGRVSERLSEYSTLVVLFITGVALIGYLYDKDSLYAVGPYSSMALHTALSFVLLGAARFYAVPDRGLIVTLSSGEPGAVMIRRLLPLTVGMLVTGGWIRLVGEHIGWVDEHFGLTLLVGFNVIGFSIILWTVARSMNQTEAMLRDSEERLRLAQSGGGIGVFDWNVKTGHLTGTPELETVLGLEPGTVRTYEDFQRRVYPDDIATWEMKRDAAVLSHQPFDLEFRIILPSGEVRWVLLRGKGAYNEIGEPIRVLGNCMNITDRKQAEQRLQDAHVLIDTLLTTAPIGFAFLDRQLRYVRINKVLADMNGLPIETHIGRHVAEIVPTLMETVQDVTDRIVASGEAVKDHEFSGETTAAPGITRYWNESWYPVRDETGAIIGFGVVAEEITARKRAEQALREAREQLERWNVELEQVVRLKTAELVQSQERLRALATELNLTEHRERKRLATELHDHLQQMLVVGKLTIGQGKRHVMGLPQCEAVFKKVDDILAEALTYSRTLVAELSPPVLRDHGLVIGVRWLVDYMKQKHELRVAVVVPEGTEIELTEDKTLLLFQSVRELLNQLGETCRDG